MKNNAKGITLIALVVTIIVLLILAGVSIMMLTGDNGILTNAQQTSTQSAYKGAEEQVKIAYMAVKTEIMAKTVEDGKYNPIENTNKLANIVRQDLGLAENDTAGNGKWKVEEDSTKGIIKITYTDSKIDQGVIGTVNLTQLDGQVSPTVVPRYEGVVHYQINLLPTQDAKLYVDTADDVDANGTPTEQGASIVVGEATIKDASGNEVTTKIQGGGTVYIHFTASLTGGTITSVTSTGLSPALTNNEWVTEVSANGTYTFTINGTTEDGNKSTTKSVVVNKFSNLPSGLKVGATVTYDPKITTSTTTHTANWSADLCTTNQTADRTLDITGTGKNNMAITSWKVLSINEANETIELISSEPSIKEVYLGHAQGYNNAVYLLNKACDDLYGGTITKGGIPYTIEGRNLNIDDIEKRMTTEKLNEAHSYGSTATWGNRTNAYTSSKNYPLIYAQEKGSIIDGTENTNQNALKLWEQTTPIARSASSSGDGKVSTATSIQPKQTLWYKDNSFMQTAFKAPEGLNETDGAINTNYNLIMPNGSSTRNYWLASRCVGLDSNYCYFYAGLVNSGGVSACFLCFSNNNIGEGSYALRPVVSLSSALISANGNNFQIVQDNNN